MSKAKHYANAVKLDILKLLEKDAPGVFEFRRIEHIMKITVPLLQSADTYNEKQVVTETLAEAESKAPNLYAALNEVAFGGESILQEKYGELKTFHDDLRRRALFLQEAHEAQSLAQEKLELRAKMIEGERKGLERERERLQLEADVRGVSLDLPELPAELKTPWSDDDTQEGEGEGDEA